MAVKKKKKKNAVDKGKIWENSLSKQSLYFFAFYKMCCTYKTASRL